MLTIKEIAQQLNVSSTTVSNVLRGKTKEASPATVERIQRFLEEVNYVPNISAQNLAKNKSKIIGLVLKTSPRRYSELLEDPFVSALVAGVEREIRGSGYYLMLYLSDRVEEILGHVSTWNADGLLLAMMGDQDYECILEAYHKPMVCIDCYVEKNLSSFINVGLEDEKAAYEATRYLLECGHTRIAMVSSLPSEVNQKRVLGYERALREASLEGEESLLFLSPQRESLGESLKEICERAMDYTALFCTSDLYALMLMAALQDRGLKVPGDISLMGFDDNLYARLHRPSLTTMHQDPVQKGILAARTLIRLLKGERITEKNLLLKAYLVERQSVGRL